MTQKHVTFTKVGQRLQDPPSESGHGVLDTGAQTEHALEVGLFQQQLPVRDELVCSAQQGSDTVYKLRHQARVRVIRLAVVICYNLENERRKERAQWQCYFTIGEEKNILQKHISDIAIKKMQNKTDLILQRLQENSCLV